MCSGCASSCPEGIDSTSRVDHFRLQVLANSPSLGHGNTLRDTPVCPGWSDLFCTLLNSNFGPDHLQADGFKRSLIRLGSNKVIAARVFSLPLLSLRSFRTVASMRSAVHR
jgi:hypothetical protein